MQTTTDRYYHGVPALVRAEWWPFAKCKTWELISQGRIPVRRCGKRVIIAESDARAVIEAVPVTEHQRVA
jgi:hypothetical protein